MGFICNGGIGIVFMSAIIASILLAVTLVLGVVGWIDWINRKRIQWNIKRNKANQPNSDWDYVKYILRRHR
jgi:hypothetical protein